MVFLLFSLLGFCGISAQIILLRELVVTSQGNELAYIIGIAFWLIGGALGSYSGSRFSHRVRDKLSALTLLLVIFFAYLVSAIYFLRAAKIIFHLPPYELVTIFPIPLFSLFLLPQAYLFGLGFVLSCSLAEERKTRLFPAGVVYLLEALGALLGGMLSYFVFTGRVSSLGVAAVVGLVIVLFLIISNFSLMKFSAFRLVLLLLMSAGIVQLFSPFGQIDRESARLRFPERQVLLAKDSRHSNIAVSETNSIYSFYENGLLSFTSIDRETNEELAHLSLTQHPQPDEILLIGGGLSGLLDELAKHPVKKLHYLELDSELVRIASRYLGAPDKKAEVINLDGRRWVKETDERYDMVIVNLPDPSTLGLNRFYTYEFFCEVKSILKEGGILAITVSSKEAYLGGVMLEYNASIYRTLGLVFAQRQVIPGETMIILSSDKTGILTADASLLMKRFRERKISTSFFTAYHIIDKFNEEKVRYINDSLESERSAANFDLRPIAFYYDLNLWAVMSHPRLGELAKALMGIRFLYLLVMVALLGLVAFLILIRRRDGASWTIPLAVGTSGFFGIGAEFIVIATYQIRYGLIYEKIGLIIASFMLGLAAGSYLLASLLSKIKEKRATLAGMEFLVVLFSLAVPCFLQFEGFVETGFFLMAMVAGALVGGEFPLAVYLYFPAKGGITRGSGIIYASDLLGAALGASLITIFFFSVFGLFQALCLVALLNLITAILLLLSRQRLER